jgi:hypothetical protein
MDRNQYNKLKYEHCLQTLANQELFGQWLQRFFYLNQELQNEFDSIYQSSFYVSYYELVTVGLDFSKNVLNHLKQNENLEKQEFYNEIIRGLSDLKSTFSESEFEFIEYKRHSSSHIFQSHYEYKITDNLKIQSKRKGKPIEDINKKFYEILLKYGFDAGFDEYMRNKLYPKITELQSNLIQIQSNYKDE